MKKLLLAALVAALPFTASATCLGDFDAPIDEHYAYWKVAGEVAQNRYGECWITERDLSYHHDVNDALACGDAKKVTTVRMGLISVPSAFNFAFDSDVVNERGQDMVSDITSAISHLDDVRVSVVGHTDAVGSDAYNQDLGLRRARNTVKEFEALGAEYRLRSSSAGESELLVDTQARELRNRRVDIYLEWTLVDEAIEYIR